MPRNKILFTFNIQQYNNICLTLSTYLYIYIRYRCVFVCVHIYVTKFEFIDAKRQIYRNVNNVNKIPRRFKDLNLSCI
jgi:hypothetical protein